MTYYVQIKIGAEDEKYTNISINADSALEAATLVAKDYLIGIYEKFTRITSNTYSADVVVSLDPEYANPMYFKRDY